MEVGPQKEGLRKEVGVEGSTHRAGVLGGVG